MTVVAAIVVVVFVVDVVEVGVSAAAVDDDVVVDVVEVVVDVNVVAVTVVGVAVDDATKTVVFLVDNEEPFLEGSRILEIFILDTPYSPNVSEDIASSANFNTSSLLKMS